MSIISNKLKLVIFLLLCSGLGFAQGSIYINTTFAATGNSTSASSINGAVDTFMLQYYTTGSPGGVSIEIDGDPGSGSFSICGAAVTTTTSGQTKCVGNFKQVRVNLTTLTGGTAPTVVATLVGNSSADEPTGTAAAQIQGVGAAGTAVASAGNPVPMGCIGNETTTQSAGAVDFVKCSTQGELSTGRTLNSADGIAVGNAVGLVTANGSALALIVRPTVFNGTTYDQQFYCNKTAKLNALGAATTQIVALVASQKIRICSAILENNSATATNVKFVEGTGANCVTGQTDVTGLFVLGANTLASDYRAFMWGASGAIITTTAADALCVTGSAAGSVEVTVTYEQH